MSVWCLLAYVSIRQHTPAYVSARAFALRCETRHGRVVLASTRQHMSAYVSIRVSTYLRLAV
jgi:hypothetical protein